MANKKKKKKKAGKAKKAAPKKKAPKKKVAKKQAPARKAAPKGKKAAKKRVRRKSDNISSVAFEPAGLGARSGGQSGDLQGLSNRGGADSESVDELLEEGNAFEAEAVKGVEDAPDADEGEVRTHEVPEDDVPEEYQEPEQ
jgi:hypothetical protein